MEDRIRLFVGCDPNDCDLEQMMVLEYSARKHCSLPIDIEWMRLSRDPASFWHADPGEGRGWRTQAWATPFSGFRWGVPAFCGYEGRAIYLDTDMVVLCDLAELWRMPLDAGKVLTGKGRKTSWRFCVTVWDCAAARSHLPSIERLRAEPDSHQRMMRYFSGHPELIESMHSDYNNIDGEGKPLHAIRILHYSDMGTQFSHKYAFPRLEREGRRHWFDGRVLPHPRADLAELFDACYREALSAGYALDDYRSPSPFGDMMKATQRDYAGNHRTRKRSLWSRLGLGGMAD